MRGRRPLPAYGRAIIAVIALYALCLHAVLGAAAPHPSIPIGGVICPAHDGAGMPEDGTPPCAQHARCPAVQLAAFAPTLAGFAAVSWPAGPATSIRWAALASPGARAPPDRSVGPRGPPAA